jgi:hypothetical protein
MGSEARMQPEHLERLRLELEDTPWNRDFLAEYITEVSRQKGEEDIFYRLAFRGSTVTGPGDSIPSGFTALYEALSPEEKAELRRWWHQKIRREAYRHDDLGRRLSWRYLV